jgi:hypothetical protein
MPPPRHIREEWFQLRRSLFADTAASRLAGRRRERVLGFVQIDADVQPLSDLLVWIREDGSMLVDVVRKLVVVGGSVSMLLVATQAHAEGQSEICLTYANGQFEPKEPTVAADAPLTIRVKNMESKAIEFESETLKLEKVIAANSEAILNVRAMKSGRYEFYNDFNEKARGFVNVQ